MSSLNLSSAATVSRADHLSTRFEDELIILGERDEIVYRLDAVGARIWELLGEPRTVSSLCEVLVAEFAVEMAACEKDVLAFLRELAAKKLILVRDNSAG